MKTRKSQCHHPKAFALVVTIALLVLLSVISLGFLSLSSIALRSGSQDQAQTQARANARLALQIAIGELQKHTGADTRVTAPATIVNEEYPQVLGVWRSWEGTDHESNGRPIPPPYTAKDLAEANGGRFIAWLVSSAATRSAAPGTGDPPSLVQSFSGKGTVPLLAGGSLLSTDARQIHVVPTTLENGGRIAWWISGENQKARLAQPYQPRTAGVAGLAEMGQSHTIPNPETFGMPSLLTDPELHHPGAADAKPGSKAASRQSMALVVASNTTEPHKKFHDLSTSATGLLTNTATGGWRKDLSILTERWDNIYAAYPGGRLPLFRYTPAAGSTTLVPRPTAGNTAANHSPAQSNLYPWSNASRIIGTADLPTNFHAASASWKSLHTFATAYKSFSSSGGVVTSPFVWDKIASPASPPTGTHIYNYRQTQRLHPQVARFQFIVYARAVESPLNQNPKRYRVDLLYVPVFTLWNPYNVGLTYTIPANATVEALGFGWRRTLPGVMAVVNQATYPNPDFVPKNVFRMFSPGNFQYLDVNGNFGESAYENGMPQNVAKGYDTGMQNGIMKVRILGNLDMRTFMASLPAGPLVFKPGETKVFSPDGYMEVTFGGTGLRLREGYYPNNVQGRPVNNIMANLTATQRLWFLMNTDKLTQPFRQRAPGIGFSLSFGKTTGNTYGGGSLHKGVSDEYHNLTTLASESQGNAYWPPTEVDEVGYSVAELASVPWAPVFSISFGPRSTIGTAPGTEQSRPTKGVLQSNPLASMVLGDPASGAAKDHPANGTFDITYHSLSMGSSLTPNLTDSKGFIATGYQSGDGLSRLVMCNIPLRPMASLVELEGWNPRGNNPYPPFQSNLFGNSDATPLIPMDRVVPPVLSPATVQTNLQHDDAYCANHLLFDDWFVSSIAPDPESFGPSNAKDISTVYREFLKGERRLPNRAYVPIAADSSVTDAVATSRIGEIVTSHDGWLKVASRLEVEGAFNVNSTSVEAWKALLGHAKSLDRIAMHGANEIVAADVSKEHVVTRGAIATDVKAGSGAGFGGQFDNASEYTGFKSLSDDQIGDLATKLVEQVRLRGPFLTLSEFVNRQLGTNKELALAGAIQAAINDLAEDPMAVLREPDHDLSDTTMPATDPKLNGVGYEFPESAAGASAYGVPGWIRQADILRPIAPMLSVRDDTFTIRAYGDSVDQGGKVVAKAWCEAVIKRTRDFCDESEPADSVNPPSSPVNAKFGRRYQIMSFRWLNPDEI